MEERDAETFDDSEFYQQLLKEFLEGSTVGSGAGALAASATVSRLPDLPAHAESLVDWSASLPGPLLH